MMRYLGGGKARLWWQAPVRGWISERDKVPVPWQPVLLSDEAGHPGILKSCPTCDTFSLPYCLIGL